MLGSETDTHRFGVLNRNGEFLGGINLKTINKSGRRGELRYFLVNSSEGKYQMSQALAAIKDYAHDDLGYKSLVAFVYSYTVRRIFEKAGFLHLKRQMLDENTLYAFQPDRSEGDVRIVAYGHEDEPVVLNGLPITFHADTPESLERRRKLAATINTERIITPKPNQLEHYFGKKIDVLDGVIALPPSESDTSWRDIPLFTSKIGHPQIREMAGIIIPEMYEWYVCELEMFLHKDRLNRTTLIAQLRIDDENDITRRNKHGFEAILRRTNVSYYQFMNGKTLHANPYN